jgi:hypothetical protein
MSDERESKSFSQKLSVVIGCLFALVLVYVLSIGPVALWCEKTHSDPVWVRQFYFPLIWLHNHTVLQRPLEVYLKLWVH